MDMTPSHKVTELGSLPKDWQTPQVQDYQPFITSGSRGWAAYYSDFGAPFIRITNMSRAKVELDLEDLRFVSLPESDGEGARTQLNDGDILVSITADIGIVAFVSPRLHKPAYINQHVALVRFDSAKINSKYVSYWLSSTVARQRFRALTDAGAKAGMNLTAVGKLQIALPPTVKEQQAIAEALSDAEALIESLEQLIVKKRNFKQGIKQELLTGRTRLSGFSMNWTNKTLSELGETLIGLTYSPDDVSSDGLLVLRSSNVQNGTLSLDDIVFVQKSIPEHIRVRKGDILICVRNGSRDLIGKSAKISADMPNTTFGAFMAVFRSDKSDFVFQQFQGDAIKRQIGEHLGATINQITNKSLNSFIIPYPEDEVERREICCVLDSLDEEISALAEKLEKAQLLKTGMMQELLTGRIRLV